MELFQAFSTVGKRRDHDFIYTLAHKANDMAKDNNLTEEIMTKVAAGYIN